MTGQQMQVASGKKAATVALMTVFRLDPTLKADTLPVASIGLCAVRLMNDRRFPWLILVPQRAGVTEIHDLTPLDQTMLTFEIATVSEHLKQVTNCHKINVAALGNQVSQLHVHVIARETADAAWPKPVWGAGTPVCYRDGEAEAFIAKFSDAF